MVDGRPGYLSILFEHRSHPGGCPPLDLLRYAVQIWSRHRAISGPGPLPPVIPLLYYHGRPVWSHPLTSGSCSTCRRPWERTGHPSATRSWIWPAGRTRRSGARCCSAASF
ncbi:MAG: Rpn family recombination-promoting nuclease/putative transposase [Thermodesulfobacteriota bacterium]